MSHFDEMKAAATEAQAILADLQGDSGRCTVAGAAKLCTPSSELQGQTLQIGGNLVTIEKTLVITAEQFTADPVIGCKVAHAGTTYKLVKFGKDGLHYLLYLETPHQ